MNGYFDSPFGYIWYAYEDQQIFGMSFVENVPDKKPYDETINKALKAYFEGQCKSFPFAFKFDGFTSFQKKVFKALLDIPYGQTRSYKEIAEKILHPKAFRAVGQACKNNPIGIMVPCHRVIGSDKSLTGYSGKNYIGLKKQLLDLEQKFA